MSTTQLEQRVIKKLQGAREYKRQTYDELMKKWSKSSLKGNDRTTTTNSCT